MKTEILVLIYGNNKSLGSVIEAHFFFILALSLQQFPNTQDTCQQP
jgi:hypothetical protein